MLTGYNNLYINRCFSGHPGIFMSLGRDIPGCPPQLGYFPRGFALHSDMIIPGCPPKHQSIFGRYLVKMLQIFKDHSGYFFHILMLLGSHIMKVKRGNFQTRFILWLG